MFSSPQTILPHPLPLIWIRKQIIHALCNQHRTMRIHTRSPPPLAQQLAESPENYTQLPAHHSSYSEITYSPSNKVEINITQQMQASLEVNKDDDISFAFPNNTDELTVLIQQRNILFLIALGIIISLFLSFSKIALSFFITLSYNTNYTFNLLPKDFYL